MRGFVLLTFEFHREGRLWVGVCRELGVAADGRDIVKLADHLGDLVEMYLNELEAAGQRENFFRERGIKVYTDDLPAEATVPTDEALNTTLIQFKKIAVDRRTSALTAANA